MEEIGIRESGALKQLYSEEQKPYEIICFSAFFLITHPDHPMVVDQIYSTEIVENAAEIVKTDCRDC